MQYSIYLLIGALFLLLSLFVLLVNFRSKQNIFLFLLSFSCALWSASFYFIYNTNNPLYISRITVLIGIFIPINFYFFIKYFINKNSKITIYEKVFFIFFPILLLSCLPFDIYLKSVDIVNEKIIFTSGFIYIINGLFFLITLLFSFLRLLIKTINGQIINKTQSYLIFFGSIFTLLMGIIFSYILPLFGISEYNILTNFSGVILLLFYSLAILKFKLLNINIIVKKTPSYIITATIIIYSFLLVDNFIINNFIEKFILLLLCIFWGFLGYPLQKFLITTAKRAFVRGYYEQEKMFNTLSKKISSLDDKEQVFETVKKVFDEEINFNSIGFLMAIRNKKDNLLYYSLEYTSEKEEKILKKISLNHPIINYLNKHHEIKYIEDMTDNTGEFNNIYKKSLLIPFHSPELLEGILLLGERSNGIALKKEDIDFFYTITNLVSAILYSLTPYEKIQQKYFENQQKLMDTERMLAISEKQAAMAALIQEYNHEIRTPLTLVLGITEELQEEDSHQDRNKKYNVIKKQSLKIDKMIEKSLLLEAHKNKEKEGFPIIEAIEEALTMVSLNNIAVKTNYHDNPVILASREDIEIVIVNLIKNANEAMQEKGEISITTKEKQDNLIIEVTDNGPGISMDIQSKIFDPFFSTKATEGRGFGLSIVFRIIRDYKGDIKINSQLGEGTTFIINLPL